MNPPKETATPRTDHIKQKYIAEGAMWSAIEQDVRDLERELMENQKGFYGTLGTKVAEDRNALRDQLIATQTELAQLKSIPSVNLEGVTFDGLKIEFQRVSRIAAQQAKDIAAALAGVEQLQKQHGSCSVCHSISWVGNPSDESDEVCEVCILRRELGEARSESSRAWGLNNSLTVQAAMLGGTIDQLRAELATQTRLMLEAGNEMSKACIERDTKSTQLDRLEKVTEGLAKALEHQLEPLDPCSCEDCMNDRISLQSYTSYKEGK